MLRRFRQIDAWAKTEGLCKARAPWRKPCALRPNVYERKSCHDDTRDQKNLISGHANGNTAAQVQRPRSIRRQHEAAQRTVDSA